MKLRGEFIRANGLVTPNNVTKVGAQKILDLCFREGSNEFWVGLCTGAFDPGLQVEDLVEPTFTNGYARKQLQNDLDDWPTSGEINGERYVESKDLVWVAAPAAFSAAVTRMFICFDDVATVGDVFALSAALPDEFIIGPTTLVADRTFRYRLYLR